MYNVFICVYSSGIILILITRNSICADKLISRDEHLASKVFTIYINRRTVISMSRAGVSSI